MLCLIPILGGLLIMIGQQDRSDALFYSLRLEDQVPETDLLRLIEKHISFAFVREKLKESYSDTGRLHRLKFAREQFLLAVVTVVPCCNNINDHGQIVGFSVDADGNLTALFWPSENTTPFDLNSLIPADSPWFLLTPGGISDAGEIATTALNLNTFELHAVVLSPIPGIGPAARGASKPPVLPDRIRTLLRDRLRYSNRLSN